MAYVDRPTDRPQDAAPAGTGLGQAPNQTQPARNRQGSTGVRPAHPLPEYRNNNLDYDRYLERSTSKFKIFSAEERRKRRKSAIAIGAVLVVVAVVVVWAILSQG